MPDYPAPFRMNPGDKASIELQYKKPLEKLDKNDDPCILYSVQVGGDGVWRTWFTSPEEDNKHAPYLAHQMIKKRGYGPGVSIDVELLSEGGWKIRGETWDDVMGGPAPDPTSNDASSGNLESKLRVKFAAVDAGHALLDARIKDLEAAVFEKAGGEAPLDDDNIPF